MCLVPHVEYSNVPTVSTASTPCEYSNFPAVIGWRTQQVSKVPFGSARVRAPTSAWGDLSRDTHLHQRMAREAAARVRGSRGRDRRLISGECRRGPASRARATAQPRGAAWSSYARLCVPADAPTSAPPLPLPRIPLLASARTPPPPPAFPPLTVSHTGALACARDALVGVSVIAYMDRYECVHSRA